MGVGKSLDKELKELRKLNTLIVGAPIVLQGVDVLKARKDTARLSQLAEGTIQLGVIAGFSQVAFELASNPFGDKKKKKMKRR